MKGNESEEEKWLFSPLVNLPSYRWKIYWQEGISCNHSICYVGNCSTNRLTVLGAIYSYLYPIKILYLTSIFHWIAALNFLPSTEIKYNVKSQNIMCYATQSTIKILIWREFHNFYIKFMYSVVFICNNTRKLMYWMSLRRDWSHLSLIQILGEALCLFLFL